jgi:hypothetical protein
LDEELEYAEFAVEDLCKGPKTLQRLNLIFTLLNLYAYFTRIDLAIHFILKVKKKHNWVYFNIPVLSPNIAMEN